MESTKTAKSLGEELPAGEVDDKIVDKVFAEIAKRKGITQEVLPPILLKQIASDTESKS